MKASPQKVPKLRDEDKEGCKTKSLGGLRGNTGRFAHEEWGSQEKMREI